MTEQVYHYAVTGDKTVERVVQDKTLHITHMVLPCGEGFPEHAANAQVYMIVVRGRLSIHLNDQETHEYGTGDVLKIPEGTKMSGANRKEEPLELMIVKLFAPKPEQSEEENR